jgi:hypothetical protein
MRKRHTLESIKLCAKTFKLRREFELGARNEYAAAQRNGWLDIVCSHMNPSEKGARATYSVEDVLLAAKKYSSRSEFRDLNDGAYRFARRAGIIDDACAHMDGNKRHTIESVCAAAMRFDSKEEFKYGSPKEYQAAYRNGWVKVACAHMAGNKRHTRDSVLSEARNFKTRREFQNNAPSTYVAALYHGWFEDACAHMPYAYKDHTVDSVIKTALGHSSLSGFRENAAEEYAFACRHKLLDVVCAHMESCFFTKDEVIAEAKKYMTRHSFSRNSSGAYGYARKHGFLDEACAHMVRGYTGFNPDRPGILYFWQFSGSHGERAWKVGITNRSAMDRKYEFRIKPGWSATLIAEIKFERGADARDAERSILSECEDESYVEGYDGPRFLKSGYTELFCVNVYERWIASMPAEEEIA